MTDYILREVLRQLDDMMANVNDLAIRGNRARLLEVIDNVNFLDVAQRLLVRSAQFTLHLLEVKLYFGSDISPVVSTGRQIDDELLKITGNSENEKMSNRFP